MGFKIQKYAAWVVLSILSVSCAREAEQTATVVIQLPGAQKMSTSSLTTFSDDNPDDDDLGWSTDIPDGLITDPAAVKPINCYAVMVEGPEPLMRINTCGRRDSSTKKIDSSLFGFKVGLWMGAIPGGTTTAPRSIPMEVPAGLARTFRLIGFHVDDIVDCILLQGDPDRTEMSRPYVIAESPPIDLVPGEKEVPLNMVFNSEKWFDDCDFGGGGEDNYAPIIATQIQIRKESFPTWQLVHNETEVRCQPLDIQLTDALGRPGRLPQGLQRVTYTLTGIAGTYSSKVACKADVSNMLFDTTFDVEPSLIIEPVRRWIKVPISAASITYNLALTQVAVDPAGAVSGISPAGVTTLNTVNDANFFMHLNAPQLALKGQAYEVELLLRSYDGTHYSNWGTSVAYTHSDVSFLFHADDLMQCRSNPLGAVLASLTNPTVDMSEKYCLKYPDVGGAFSSIIIDGQYAGRVEARAGGIEPQRLRIVGSNQISRLDGSERCYGPLSVVLENEYGAAVTNLSGSGVDVSYSFALTSDIKDDSNAAVPLEFHSSATSAGTSPNIVKVCPSSGAQWSSGSGNTQQLEINHHQLPFYIKVPPNATLGWRKMNFSATVNGRVIRGSYRFSIDTHD